MFNCPGVTNKLEVNISLVWKIEVGLHRRAWRTNSKQYGSRRHYQCPESEDRRVWLRGLWGSVKGDFMMTVAILSVRT